MIVLEAIVLMYIVTHLAAAMLLAPMCAYNGIGFAWLNPMYAYEHLPINWFGAGLIALLGHIMIPGIAVIYWMYKLCTVGRR